MEFKYKQKRLHVLIAYALAGGTLTMIGATATAQQAPERVIITGSQIPRADIETPSPVQVITAEEIKSSGFTTISEVLNSITANGQGTLSQGFNQAFAGGASGVSLRGLTVGATLVLIDGHRMAPYPLSDDGQRAFVDISSIPFEAIERIEILKDGASAVYGSDAIAGVVNVILKKKFEGTSINAEAGTSQHGGGQTKRVSVMHGFGNKDDHNGYLSLEWRKQDPILLSQRSGRDWTNFDWRSQGGEDLRPGALNSGNAALPRTSPAYLFRNTGGSAANPADYAFLSAGCNFATVTTTGCLYNNTWAQIQPGSENLNLLGSYTTKLSGDWDLNLKASLFDSKNQQIRRPDNIPSGSWPGVTAIGPGLIPKIVGAIPTFTVPANYPGNTLGVAARVRGIMPLQDWPNGRSEDFDTKSTRLVAELNGSMAGWDIKSSAGYTKVETTTTFNGFINYAGLNTALNNPADPFLLTGGNDASNKALAAPTVSNVQSSVLKFVDVRGSRELMKLQGGPLSLGVGVGYMVKDLNAQDPLPAQLGVMGMNGAYAVGSDTNKSAYVELVAPVLKKLELDAAARYDNWKSYGSTTTPKVGFKFTPIEQFGIRGTASRGFRAPAPTENGTAGSLFSFNKITDPILCPTGVATAATTVVGTCSFQPTYLQGTSTNLQPEKSKSYTLGIIVEPIKRWSTTLDYYKITLDNQIIPAASLAGFNPLAFIVRGTPQQVVFGDGSTGVSPVGLIQYVNTPYVNGQSTETSGLELDTRYKFDLKQYGSLTAGLMFTHMLKYDLTLDGVTYKLAGTHGPSIIGGDTGNPRDRAALTFKWERGPLTVSTVTNYVSSYDVTDSSSGYPDCVSGLQGYNSQFGNVAVPPTQYCKVPSFTYTNLNVRYQLDKKWTVYGSIVNLFDQQPPLDLQTYGGAGSNGNSIGTGTPYNPSLHQVGAIGRFFSIGANYKF